RRRMASEPAEEVSLDEIVLIDESAEAANDESAWVPAPLLETSDANDADAPAIDAVTEPLSVAPLALDVAAPFDVPIARGPLERPRRLGAPMVISLLALG